ncbi:probable peptidoglycan muropeptide transporter SLC46 isoform X2 [Anabrus simplex]|uniref:probable peptidoglycan muropeptide transporter SLC46 isoform X2 n=1 Tax=Anabrus simplex TaxID=316456 RepID=UPI0035A388C0
MDDTCGSRSQLLPSDDIKINLPKAYHRWITVEPLVVLVFFSSSLSGTILTNLYLYQTCRVTLNFNYTVCAHLDSQGSDSELHHIETLVQPHTTVLLLGKSLLESCVPAVLSFFLGPWSDLYGRRPLLMWSLLGYSVMYFSYLGATFIPSLPPSFLLFASLPLGLSGGSISIFSGMYSYVTDVSTPEKRSLRIGIVDACLYGGMLAGASASSFVFTAAGDMGYLTIFAISGVCCFLGFLYCAFLLPESINRTQAVHPSCCLGHDLFQWHYIIDVLKTSFKARPNHGRVLILLTILALASFISTFDGEGAVAFLFTRNKFGWTIKDYTLLLSTNLVISIFGMLLGTSIFSTWLQVPDAPLVMFGYFCKAVAAVLAALSPVSWYLYAAIVIGVSGSLVGPLSRSLLTKIVPGDEIGKVFSLLASLEALTPLASSAVYTLLYTATLNIFPGAYLLLSAGIFSFDALMLLCVLIIQHIVVERELGCSADNEIN